ncbi:MAG: hypothetical protein A3J74_03255 [Elusimicrobia bacterium RIFCSPHIGHO2_02_FULL_57_9]|nr:MAG: hypothetical protein A3J74_03255 [Elusimicrobia bacterium RIFCSPHIGHO2_02_FULL_57_9]
MAKPKRKNEVLGELIRKNHRLLAVLDKHGVTFCAGCFLTLFSSPQRAGAYHAVPDLKKFLADLRRASKS